MAGAIFHQPPYAFMACTRTTAPVMTTTTSSTAKIKTETTATTYPDAEKVAVACIFPFPLNSNRLHEVTVFWVVTSVCTSQVSSQASHHHGKPTSGTVMNVVLSAAAMLSAGYFRSVVRLATHCLRNTFSPQGRVFFFKGSCHFKQTCCGRHIPTHISFSLNLGFD